MDFLKNPSPATLRNTALVLVGSSIIYALTQLYRARMRFISCKRRGLPVAPNHSFLFGHLLYAKTKLDALPKGAHQQLLFADIAREHFAETGLYYIDLWPLSGLTIIIFSPNPATEVAQTNPKICTERALLLTRFFKPIAGGPNLFDMPGEEWRPWRNVFAKGFSDTHISSLVPSMIKETIVYSKKLDKLARTGELFHLDTMTLRFMMDMIGGTLLNTSLKSQEGYNVLADSMLSQIRWQQPNAESNLVGYFNIMRWFMQWWNGRHMDRYIGNELDKRFAELHADPNDKRHKAVIDLVLQAYFSQKPELDRLDPEFRTFAIRQMRLFLFTGHDSTSTTICYSFHLLSEHPTALARIRAEHDAVLGEDPHAAPTLLEERPHLLNELPYTNAVVKEALRLYPPAGTSRQGQPNADIHDDQGNVCPTNHALILTIHTELHRSPAHWTRPDEFLPERWLDPPPELVPEKGAWRPFEHGVRNCLAQNMVMTELRVVLACIVRLYDFRAAYADVDRKRPTSGLKTYRGDRAYLMEGGAAHPVDHYPCRVFARDGMENGGIDGLKVGGTGER